MESTTISYFSLYRILGYGALRDHAVSLATGEIADPMRAALYADNDTPSEPYAFSPPQSGTIRQWRHNHLHLHHHQHSSFPIGWVLRCQ